MQCKARYCREKKELPFPLKSGYFTEIRCADLAVGDGPDSELCEKCQRKAAKPFRVACQQGQYQGKIDEPYYDGSWIFGSDRFFKFQTMPGNAISEEEYARAEAAQKIARQGSEMKKKAEPKIATVVPSVVPSEKSLAAPPKEKTTKVTKPTKVMNKVVAPPSVPLQKPVAVELLDEPIEALEVIKIKVKLVERKDSHIWFDTATKDIYEYGPAGTVGKKLGNSEGGEDDEENDES